MDALAQVLVESEKKPLDLDATAGELLQFWAGDNAGGYVEVKFIADDRRTYRKTIQPKDKFTSAAQAMAYLKDNIATAQKFFGPIVGIELKGGDYKPLPMAYNSFRPTAPREILPFSKQAGRRAPYLNPNARERTAVYDPLLFRDLPEKPEDLKKYALNRLQTRRAALVESGLIELRNNQREALDKLEKFLTAEGDDLRGYIVQPTGAGKTVLFGLILVMLDMPSIILVPDSNLLLQIKEELIKTLKVDADEIGLLDKTHRDFGRKFIIATYAMHNSLMRRKNPNYKRQIKSTALMVCDEAHDALGEKTAQRISQVDSDETSGCIRIGFTATPQLLSKHVKEHFGREIAMAKFSDQVKEGVLVKLKLIEIGANIYGGEIRNSVIDEEDEDKIVNREQLFERTLEKYGQLREKLAAVGIRLITAVYVNRVAHAYRYHEMAKEKGWTSAVVAGGQEDSEELRARIKDIERSMLKGKTDMVIAVRKMAQGWDFKPLNCVILASPMTSPKSIIQRIGRGARSFEGKDCCYVIAPNYKIHRSKGKVDRTLAKIKRREGVERKERNEDDAYVLGDNISVLDSLREFGESEENLTEFCQVVDRSDAPDTEKDVAEFHWISPEAPLHYFKNYFNKPARVSDDLQSFAVGHGLGGIEYLRTHHFDDESMKLASGELLKASDYLKIATMILLDRNAPRQKGLRALKNMLGIVLPSLKDPAYYTPPRVRADLALNFNLGRSRDEFYNFCANDVADENEKRLSGSSYIEKARVALGMTDKRRREVFNYLKALAAQPDPEIKMEEIPTPDESHVRLVETGTDPIEEILPMERIDFADPAPVVVAMVKEEVAMTLDDAQEMVAVFAELVESMTEIKRNRWDLSYKRVSVDLREFANRYDTTVGQIKYAEMADNKFKAARMGEVTLKQYLQSFQELISEELRDNLNEEEILGLLKRVMLVMPLGARRDASMIARVYTRYYKENDGRNVYHDLKAIAYLVGVSEIRDLKVKMFDERQFLSSSDYAAHLDNYLELAGSKLHTTTRRETLQRLMEIADGYLEALWPRRA